MDYNTMITAIENRATVTVGPRNGRAELTGKTFVLMGYCSTTDNVKLGFIGDDGKYTGDFVMVGADHIELTDVVAPAAKVQHRTEAQDLGHVELATEAEALNNLLENEQEIRAAMQVLSNETLATVWAANLGQDQSDHRATQRILAEFERRMGDRFDTWLYLDQVNPDPLPYLA